METYEDYCKERDELSLIEMYEDYCSTFYEDGMTDEEWEMTINNMISFRDWCNNQKMKTEKELMSFEEAKAYMQTIGLNPKTEKEAQEMFQQWWDENKQLAESIGLPRHPEIVYNNK